MPLYSHSILIVESEVSSFARSLRAAIKRQGGEPFVARDAVMALELAKQARFSAALVNADHVDLVDRLQMPVLLYGKRPPPLVVPFVSMPARPAKLALAVERLLQTAQ
jgi:hypothetical protein